MLDIFSKRFIELDEEELRELVEVRNLPEHIHLEYKREMYEDDFWDKNGKREMLADVTAMANAQGGYIVIGVEEDEDALDGTPEELKGLEPGDRGAGWIRDICVSSIDEKISGLRTRDVELSNGRFCTIIQVPNSARKPHMVSHGSSRSFWLRHGASKHPMNMSEVRDMVISTSRSRESLEEFIEGRIAALRTLSASESATEQWLYLMATPVGVDRDKVNPLRDDIREIIQETPGAPDDLYIGVRTGEPRPTEYGVEAFTPKEAAWAAAPYDRVLRLFRNGHLEFGQNFSHVLRMTQGQTWWIPAYRTSVTLLHFLNVGMRITDRAGIYEPITITLHWEGIDPAVLDKWDRSRRRPTLRDDVAVWREPTLRIQATVDGLSDPSRVAQLLMDTLFNAFGYEGSPQFDEDGNFLPPS